MSYIRRLNRAIRYWYQRRTRGWDDSDLWSLDYTILEFTLPRLKRFKEVSYGYPTSLEEDTWEIYLNEMIWAIEYIVETEWYPFPTELDHKRVRNGMDLFFEYFHSLWS